MTLCGLSCLTALSHPLSPLSLSPPPTSFSLLQSCWLNTKRTPYGKYEWTDAETNWRAFRKEQF